MLLALDVGNTNITIGAFDGQNLIGYWRLRTIPDQTPDEWGILMRNLFSLSSLDPANVRPVKLCPLREGFLGKTEGIPQPSDGLAKYDAGIDFHIVDGRRT